jgi:hypothetical protein
MLNRDDAALFRQRAARLRAIAAEDRSHANRELLERVARDYEQMARDTEGGEAANLR